MAKKKRKENEEIMTMRFPQPIIWNCWASGNHHDIELTHEAIMIFLDDIERGLSKSDSNIYATAFFAVQTITRKLTAENLEVLVDDCAGMPFIDVMDIILKDREGFMDLLGRLELPDIVSLLLKAPYCCTSSAKIDAPNFANYGNNPSRKSPLFDQIALSALENHEDESTTYADFGAGYGDFSVAVAASGFPCSLSVVCEKDAEAVKVAAARLCIADYNTIFDLGDIFATDWDCYFDRIFCEPSFNDAIDQISDEYMNAVNERYGLDVSYADHDWLYALCVAEHLADDGKGLVVVRQSSLDNAASENGRRILLGQKMISGIVSLPETFAVDGGERPALVVLRKNSENVVLHDADEVDNRGSEASLDNYSVSKLCEILRAL